MRKYGILILFIGFGIIMNACTPPHYIPNNHTIPLHQGQDEVYAAILSGTSGADGNLSYSFTDFLSIQAAGNMASMDSMHYRYGEIGVSVFSNPRGASNFSLSSGYGRGEVLFEKPYIIPNGKYYASYDKIFLKPTVGFVNTYIEGALTTGVALIQFDKLSNNQSWTSFNQFYFEPAITVKAGYDFIKIMVQMGLVLPMFYYENVDFQPVNAHIGLSFRLPVSEK